MGYAEPLGARGRSRSPVGGLGLAPWQEELPPSDGGDQAGASQAGYNGYSGLETSGTQHVPGITDRRFEGKILSVSPDKGFGFIQCPPQLRGTFNNKDIFIHKTQMSNFRVNDTVSFGVILYRDGKPQAKDLRGVRNSAVDPVSLGQGLTALVSALAPVLSNLQQNNNNAGGGQPNPLAALAAALGAQAPSTSSSSTALARTAAPGHSAPEITIEIEVHADLIGALVGKQGASIHELERRAGGGVHIQVHPAKFEGGMQLAQVTGPQDRAGYGASLVRQKLEEIRQSRIAHDMIRSGQLPEQVPPNARPECIHEIEVAPDLIGALVGKQGACIQELQRRGGGGVHIQIHQPKVPGGSQIAQITGPTSGANLALFLVQQKLSEIQDQRQQHELGGVGTPMLPLTSSPTFASPTGPDGSVGLVPLSAGDTMHEVEVPPDLVGALIGRQGACIHDLERQAGLSVRIQIPPAAVPGTSQVAQITGPAVEANIGKMLVEQKLEELRRERMVHEQPQQPALWPQLDQPPPAAGQFDYGVGDDLGAPAPQAFPSDPGYPGMPQPGDVAHQVEVPADLVGALIGKQGACINELQSRSGAGVHVEILPPQTIGGPQYAQVTGPAQQAAYGASLVHQKVEELRRERTAHEMLRVVGGHQVSAPPTQYTQPAASMPFSAMGQVAPQAPVAGAMQAGQAPLNTQALAQMAAALLGAAMTRQQGGPAAGLSPGLLPQL